MEKKRDKRRRLREIGAKGGLKGGPARAAALSPARRQEIARSGAQARARKKPGARPVNDTSAAEKWRTAACYDALT